ncbi:hypothetical protein M885DRAFT_504914 [Pelagophyceae sp. CCMP2097]|nr:hypothetical protein M885DRAFT_504914 [Pelagophyceae sp. CCMP2097]
MKTGVHAKARLAQLSVELEDADKALWLLGSACDKEAAAHRADVAHQHKKHVDAGRAATAQRHAALAALLGQADGVVRDKEALTAQCAALAEAARVSHEELAQRLRLAEEASRVEAVRCRADWDRGASARRKAYLAAQTEQIRELTVKGLEPEIERLMEKQKLDMAELEQQKRWAAALMRRELEETQQRARELLRDGLRGKHADAEGDERRGVADRLCEAEAARRAAYAAAVERSAEAAGRLRRDLEQRRANEARGAAADAAAARQHAEERLQALQDRHVAERRETLKLLQAAQVAVSMARADDLGAARSSATEDHDRLLEDDVSAAAAAAAAQRDAAIDAQIRDSEKRALAKERDVRSSHEALKSELRHAHVDAFAALRKRRSEWVDGRVEALREIEALRTNEAAAVQRLAAAAHARGTAEAACAGPRRAAARAAADVDAALADVRGGHAAAAAALADSLAAAAAAAAAVQAAARRQRAAHQAAVDAAAARHERSLAARDAQVTKVLAALSSETAQIRDALELEGIKYEHRCKLLRGYATQQAARDARRARPAQRPPAEAAAAATAAATPARARRHGAAPGHAPAHGARASLSAAHGARASLSRLP